MKYERDRRGIERVESFDTALRPETTKTTQRFIPIKCLIADVLKH